MKLAMFYSGYLPGEKYGGPVSSLYNLTELLGEEMEIYIICSNHDLKENKPYEGIGAGWNRVGKAQVMYLADAEFNRMSFQTILNELKPDLVYASSFFSAGINLPLLRAVKQVNIPLLLAPRGELNPDALKRGAFKKRGYIAALKFSGLLKRVRFQATSEGERADVARALGVNAQNVILIPNVPALPNPKPQLSKQPGAVRVCFAGRIVPNKNLLYAIEAVQAVRCRVDFDIYGSNENVEYWKLCASQMDRSPENVRISYKGALKPAQMREAYADYDCLISPTEFENYGQSIVEAMLHDTPVIISKGTTPWDGVNEHACGYAIELKDKSGFTSALETIAAMDSKAYESLVSRLRAFCQTTFDFEKLKCAYLDAFKSVSKR